MEDEEKLRWSMEQMKILKAQYGGHGQLKRDDEDLKLVMQLWDREARVLLDADTGWAYLEMDCANRRGKIDIKFEDGKKPGVQSDDEWEDESDEVVQLLAPGVYIEDEPDEVARMAREWQGLSLEVQQAIILSLRKKLADGFGVFSDEIRCGMDDEFYSLRDPKERFDKLFRIMRVLAMAFERD